MATHRGIRIHQYLDDWLVRARSHQACLQLTQELVQICRNLGWLVNLEKSELEPKQIFNFVGYQFDLQAGRVRPTTDWWQSLQDKILHLLSLPSCSVRVFMSLIGLLTATEKQVHRGRLQMRPIQWHLKSNWRVPESLEKRIPVPRSLHPHLQWWLDEENVLTGQPLHPMQHALQIFTDATKGGWGAHLIEHTAKGIWSLPESIQTAHKLPRTQGSISSLKRVPDSLFRQNSTGSNGQHYSSVIHKQGRRLEVGNSMCPSLENSDLVHQKSGHLKSQTYPWPVECSSRQAFQARTDHPDRVVPPSSSVQNTMRQMAPTSNRSLCNQIQQQGPPVCVTSSGHHGHCSRCTQSIMGEAGCLCLPTDSHIGQSGGEVAGTPCARESLSLPQGGPTCLGSGTW